MAVMDEMMRTTMDDGGNDLDDDNGPDSSSPHLYVGDILLDISLAGRRELEAADAVTVGTRT